jgi:predicted PurR-regulated permease PerM
MTILAPAQQARAFRWVVLVLAIAAIATFVPVWVSLVLAAWAASIARPLLMRVSQALGGRGRAAGVLVAGLVVVLVVPLAATLVSLSRGVVSLAKSVMGSSGAKSALVSLVSPDGGGGDAGQLDLLKSPAKIIALVQEHGAKAFEILGGIAGAATEAFVGLFIFLYAVYVFLVDGPDYYDWLEKHAPLEPSHTERLAAAFTETGRGLLVGIGLTGVTQGAVATVAYLALGVPRAFVLGLLTCLASVIPSVGTALVWVPVAAGLAFSGKVGSAAILAAVGVLVIGSVDNLMRPIFSRFGKLELSSFVLLVSIFGGLALFGTWGFILGPLCVRLAKEALVIARRDRLHDKREEIDAAREAAGEPAAESS